MKTLPPKRRSELRAEAHKLSPLVIIGDKGLTDEVVAEIDRTLKAHELIKVRATTDDRKARDEWLGTLCERLEAHGVQQIGKIYVLYRENPKEKEELRKPRAAPIRDKREARDGKPAAGRRKPVGRDAKTAGGRSRFEERDAKPAGGTNRRVLQDSGAAGGRKKSRGSLDPWTPVGPKGPSAGRTRTRASTLEQPATTDDSGRRRSRTPSPRPASGPPRRPRSTSR